MRHAFNEIGESKEFNPQLLSAYSFTYFLTIFEQRFMSEKARVRRASL